MYATGFASRLIEEAQTLLASGRDRTPESELALLLDRIARAIAARGVTLAEVRDVQERGLQALSAFLLHLEAEMLRELEFRPVRPGPDDR